MYRNRKIIGIILLLITIMTWVSPTAEVLAASIGVVKADSKLKGVTYKLNPEVVEMPYGIDYDVLEEEVINYEEIEEPITEEEVLKNSIKRKVNIPTKTKFRSIKKGLQTRSRTKIPTNISTEEPTWNREKDYTPKAITVDSTTLRKINPKVGKILYDPVNHTTVKVTGNTKTTGTGEVIIPVEKPDISEVVDDVNIPEQVVTLSKEDISYIHPEIEIVETNVASESYLAANDGFIPSDREEWIKIKLDGLTLINIGKDADNKEVDKEREEELKKDIWKSDKEKELDKEEQEQIEKDREQELNNGVVVKVKKGYIKIFDPQVSASLDWKKGVFNADVKADIDIESDIIVEGKVSLNQEVEILIQGFELDFQVGKIACGIYLVVGIDGKITFEARVQQQGTATIGAAATGFLIPMVVYPIADYNNTALETQMILSGELKYWALAMPKVSLKLLDWDILDAGFRIGIEAGANFYVSTEEPSNYRLWIDLLLQLRVKVIPLNEKTVLDKRINLYDKTKVYDASQPAGGGSEGVNKQRGFVLIEIEKMDAARDIIRGSIARAESPTSERISCKGDKAIIRIKHVDGSISDHEVILGEYGAFYLNKAITPLDMVSISYDKLDISYNYKTETPFANVKPPYTVNSIFRDGFNNKVFGEISGEIYGPNEIALDGDEEKFSEKVYVRISKDINSGGTGYYIPVDEEGKFSLNDKVLKNEDQISAGLVFEGAQVESERKNPELGLEIYHSIIESEDKKSFSIIGSIHNLYGDKLFKDSVKLYNGVGTVVAESKAYAINEIPVTEEKPTTQEPIIQNPNQLNIKPSLPGLINISKDFLEKTSILSIKDALIVKDEVKSIPSTFFELKDIPIPLDIVVLSGGASLEIEYNGIKKNIKIIGGGPKPVVPELGRAVVSPIDDIINSRINPVMRKDMRSAISKQAIQYQDPSFKVDTSENHAVFYSFVSTPPSQDNIYSFREGDLTLSTKGENNTIVLTWDTLLDKSIIEGYRLYRGTYSNGEDLKPINTTIIKDLRYIDKDVNFGTNYYYLCSVVYKNGNEFIISNEAMGVTVK